MLLLIVYTIRVERKLYHCLFCLSRARQEGSGDRQMMLELLNEAISATKTLKTLQRTPCFRRTNKVCSRFRGNRQTDTHRQNDYCNPMAHAPMVNKYSWLTTPYCICLWLVLTMKSENFPIYSRLNIVH